MRTVRISLRKKRRVRLTLDRTCLTHCTFLRPLVSLSVLFTGPTKSTTIGTRSKTTSPITLCGTTLLRKPILRRVSVAHSERPTAATLHEEDVGDRGAIHDGRGVGGRRGDGTPTATPATSHAPPPLPCSLALVLLSLSHHRTPAAPATPSTYRLPCRRTRASPCRHPLAPSVPSRYPARSHRGSHHRLRYRLAQLSLVRARQSLQHPNTAHHRLLHLHSHLHLPPPFLSPAPPSRSSLFRPRGDTNCKKVFHATVMRQVGNGQIFTTITSAVDQSGTFFIAEEKRLYSRKGT